MDLHLDHISRSSSNGGRAPVCSRKLKKCQGPGPAGPKGHRADGREHGNPGVSVNVGVCVCVVGLVCGMAGDVMVWDSVLHKRCGTWWWS